MGVPPTYYPKELIMPTNLTRQQYREAHRASRLVLDSINSEPRRPLVARAVVEAATLDGSPLGQFLRAVETTPSGAVVSLPMVHRCLAILSSQQIASTERRALALRYCHTQAAREVVEVLVAEAGWDPEQCCCGGLVCCRLPAYQLAKAAERMVA